MKHIQYIKTSKMAQLLSRSVKQFRADVIKLSIPHIKLGRTRIFDPLQVVEYLTVQPQLSVSMKEPQRKVLEHFPKTKNKSSNLSETEDVERYKKMVGLE